MGINQLFRRSKIRPIQRRVSARVGKNVEAIYQDSITDSVHKLLQQYADDDVDTILVAWRRKNEDGSKTIHTNYHGWPSDAFGLLEFLKEIIRAEMWER